MHEPPKPAVLGYRDGEPFEREAFVIIPANADGVTYELVASITALAACITARWHRAADADRLRLATRQPSSKSNHTTLAHSAGHDRPACHSERSEESGRRDPSLRSG
ncbi:MAG: hypothetical protein ACRERE_45730 [Candidatus Entotheonellia bacterium]